MKRNCKVSNSQGWLKKASNYAVEDIDGGQDIAKKLIAQGDAVEIEADATVTKPKKPRLPNTVKESEKVDIKEIRSKRTTKDLSADISAARAKLKEEKAAQDVKAEE